MRRNAQLALAAGVVVLVVGGGGAAVVAGTLTDDGEGPIPAAELAPASAAALAHTGQGRVTETEVGDEDSYYEVEVTLDDGSQVDVQLDRSFHVVTAMADDDHGSDEDGAED
jgi:hypothetical protein